MKIGLDAIGGDFAPIAAITGAKLAIQQLPDDASIVLFGPKNAIISEIESQGIDQSIFEIVDAPELIEMGEHPTKAMTNKLDSSIVQGFKYLKEKKIQSFCGAGNTGAMHVGAMFTIKAIEGIIRPGIAGFVPKESGDFGILIDIGANADCRPDVLLQFGEIGSVYSKHVFGIENPKVGLINLGEEEQKGTLNTQAAYQLFKLSKRINFIGNIEGRDLFNDKADVMVCDGFTGNVILKLIESFYDLMIRRDIKNDYFDRFDYEAIGGSPVLGINGNVVIGHGVSNEVAIKNMIILAYRMAESNIYHKIKEAFSD
ncbi:MAG: phosphate--acyl-ACP acyltransferase [Bacteroidetes bacterium]|nr:phosphate--acyl-ACP acyltransferase [Bacteroidota bacterium]MDA1120646.1 phosphate--acyl-ACP acyltransferase [Bacteroidota bacterium]